MFENIFNQIHAPTQVIASGTHRVRRRHDRAEDRRDARPVLEFLLGGGGAVVSFLALVAMWEAMMIAMMAPTVAPWLRAFDRMTSEGREGGRAARIASFAAGYATVWLGYSAVAAAAQLLLHRTGWLSHAHVLAAPLGALVFIGAGLFQFAPSKRACLTHCRNPLDACARALAERRRQRLPHRPLARRRTASAAAGR